MAKVKKMKKDKCTCTDCSGGYITKTIGGLIVAITALVVIFDKAHLWVVIPLAAFLVFMGLALFGFSKSNKK